MVVWSESEEIAKNRAQACSEGPHAACTHLSSAVRVIPTTLARGVGAAEVGGGGRVSAYLVDVIRRADGARTRRRRRRAGRRRRRRGRRRVGRVERRGGGGEAGGRSTVEPVAVAFGAGARLAVDEAPRAVRVRVAVGAPRLRGTALAAVVGRGPRRLAGARRAVRAAPRPVEHVHQPHVLRLSPGEGWGGGWR